MNNTCPLIIFAMAFSVPFPAVAQQTIAPRANSVDLEQMETLIRLAPKRFEDSLNDYSSTQFRDTRGRLRVLEDGTRQIMLCGEIKAKNGFGAYTGWHGFALVLKPEFFTTDNDSFFRGSYALVCNSQGSWLTEDVAIRITSGSAQPVR